MVVGLSEKPPMITRYLIRSVPNSKKKMASIKPDLGLNIFGLPEDLPFIVVFQR
jgi:hypothetical protein